MNLATPVKLLAAVAMLGMLPLAASRLGAVTQFSPEQTDRDIRALETEVERLHTRLGELETTNRDLYVKVALMDVRLTGLDTAIGKSARDFVIGSGAPNKTIAMRLGQYNLSSVVLDGKTATITAETIDLKGKFIRIDATRTLTLNGETVDVTGGKVNVKGSSPLPIKGVKVLGN
ncbi:hypothetical protein [Novosphingobium sp.]|uniref:hypothetical protein n=1 Tax=Novosphingobium sp. TaxID=1874826 RepID=UPI002733BEAC|nr:hypothetical protein [Novosphingobium sp.]MDP3907714.1 hypothetical protein [Novosphingobium sp.]